MWSPVIRSDVIDYGDVVETTSDKFLLVNILEARDNAPLHFMEFPKVSGSLTATASLQSAIPFAPQAVGFDGGGIIDPTLTPNIGVTASPTFEVDNVDTTDFTTGVSSEVAPKFIKYWTDRGLDKRLILLMFFSSATITENTETPESCNTGKTKRLSDPSSCALELKAEAVEDIGSCQRVLQGAILNPAQCVEDMSLVGVPNIPHCSTVEIGHQDGSRICAGSIDSVLDECREKQDGKLENSSGCSLILGRFKLPDSCQTHAKKPEQCADDLTQRLAGASITIFDDPRKAADTLSDCASSQCHAITEFEIYLKLMNVIRDQFKANIYTEKSLLAEKVRIDNSDVPNYDPTQYELEGVTIDKPLPAKPASCKQPTKHSKQDNCVPGYGIFNIYSVSPAQKVAFCFGVLSTDKCTQRTIIDRPTTDQSPSLFNTIQDDLNTPHDPASTTPCENGRLDASDAPPNPSQFCRVFWDYLVAYESALKCAYPLTQDTECHFALQQFSKRFNLGLTTRSPAEMVRFVGDVLYYDKRLPDAEHASGITCDPYHNFPLTLSWDTGRRCSQTWKVDSEAQDIVAEPSSDGEYTHGSGGCLFRLAAANEPTRFNVVYKGEVYRLANHNTDDHSLEVLSILNQVINLNKKASDLRITPIIQVVP